MENKQTFPEVFPDYHIPDNLKYVLSNTIVTRVVMKQSKNQLIVHTKGEHILGRKLVNKIAFDLKNELFRGTSLFLVIDDTYELSPVYTLEQLTKDYWDSILYELHRMGQVEYSLFLHCEWGFEGRIMTILLEDSFLARSKAPKLKQYLEEMYSHRFGKEIQVGFDFTDAAKQAFYKARNHKLDLEVGMVMEQIEKAEAEKAVERRSRRRKRTARNRPDAAVTLPTFSRREPEEKNLAVMAEDRRTRISFTERTATGRSFPSRRSWTRSERWSSGGRSSGWISGRSAGKEAS